MGIPEKEGGISVIVLARMSSGSQMAPSQRPQPGPSSYPLLGPKYPLLGTIYPQLRVQGRSWNIKMPTSKAAFDYRLDGKDTRSIESQPWTLPRVFGLRVKV